MYFTYSTLTFDGHMHITNPGWLGCHMCSCDSLECMNRWLCSMYAGQVGHELAIHCIFIYGHLLRWTTWFSMRRIIFSRSGFLCSGNTLPSTQGLMRSRNLMGWVWDRHYLCYLYLYLANEYRSCVHLFRIRTHWSHAPLITCIHQQKKTWIWLAFHEA